MQRILLISIALILEFSGVHGQDLALGQWKVHLPYIKARKVAIGGDRVYCASDRGLFYYQTTDNSVVPLSKITGLSELDVSCLEYDKDTKVLFIAYANSNIDLIAGNKIINISDIKRKNLTGDKNIYNIEFHNRHAYLSCGFGIVVVDLDRNEIRDTYVIGPNGTEIRVFDIAFLGNNIYAATENGVFIADINNANLANFANWSVVLPDNGNAGDFNQIENFNNTLLVNYAKPDAFSDFSQDDIWFDSGSGWAQATLPQPHIKNYSMRSSGGFFSIANSISLSVYNNTFNLSNYIDWTDYADPVIRDGRYDDDGMLWIADNSQGLIRFTPTNNYNFIVPDGPASELVSAMATSSSRMYVTHATRTSGWFNSYTAGQFSEYFNNDWISYNNKTVTGSPIDIGSFYDMMSLAIDPANSQHVFLGSKGNGILEMAGGMPVNTYRDTNSTLQVGIGNPQQCQVVGMGFDDSRNLWVLNSLAAKPVNVRTESGQWYAFSIPGISGAPLFGDMTVDSYNQKWINIIGNNPPYGNGLVVYDNNGTLDVTNDDRARFVGKLPSTDVRAITEDLENEIWLGTSKGVAVVYSPSSAFTSDDFEAQQILINQDGVNQYLLESEVVTAIAIDGANRKWIGTESGGLFLMSADGTKQILNFNENNSPILSNYILALSIDQKTGEVFIGTNRGLISYKGDAISGTGGCSDVLVYPNPVRENYAGPIAIKGLVPNGNVKITDVSGNLVFETTALGTQAIWYGKKFNGEKVHTGVYLVFSTDEDGENTCVTKLLLVN